MTYNLLCVALVAAGLAVSYLAIHRTVVDNWSRIVDALRGR